MTDPELQSALERIGALESQVTALFGIVAAMAPPGQGGPAPNDPELLQAVQAGDKIRAIKRYREMTGLGLEQAKAAIDQLMP